MTHASNTGSMDGFINFEDKSIAHDVAGVIRLPGMVGNVVFHVTRTMIHIIKMKGVFGGLASEDVNRYVRKFIEICHPFNISNISQKSIKLRLFTFSLMGEATAWLEDLSPKSITLRSKLKEAFLDQFFLPSRRPQFHDETMNFRQLLGEPLHEVLLRFKKKVAMCPNHGLSNDILLQDFHCTLDSRNKTIINTLVWGALMDQAFEAMILQGPLEVVLLNQNSEGMEGFEDACHALKGLGSYSYQPKMLGIDLKNQKTLPSQPSIIEPPVLELKPLLSHLRYAYLGENEILS